MQNKIYPRNYFPWPSQLWTSMRLRGKEYLRENTLHGFPYFVNPRRPLWERIVWFICTGASIGAALGIISSILTKFRVNPTITVLDIDTDNALTHFPSVTLCQENPQFDFGDYESDAEHYNKMYKWSWKKIESPSKQLKDESYGEFFLRTGKNCEDLYKDCVYMGKSVSCGQLMKKIIWLQGMCCYIDSAPITKGDRPWMLSFTTDAFPINVNLLEKVEEPAPRDSSFWYHLETGVAIRIRVQLTYATGGIGTLTRGQRRCLYETTSYNRCMYRCHSEQFHYIGCYPWFMHSLEWPPRQHSKPRSTFPYCTLSEHNIIAANETLLRRPKCNCLLSCNHSSYTFERVKYRSDNRVIINMPNWPPLIYRREVKFGWLDLLVSFGGMAGLFVGYSLLTSVEFGYYFTLRCYCGAVLAETDKTIKIKVASAKRRVVKTIDIKNHYWDYVN